MTSTTTCLLEDLEQAAPYVALAPPAISSSSDDFCDAFFYFNVFHCVHEHANEFLLREIAKSLGVKLYGKLRLGT